MKRILFTTLAVSASISAFAANAINFDVNTGSTGINSNQTVGWQFNVNTEITVTHLAWYDHDQDGIDRHEVGIWAPDGTLITSDILPGGTAATLDGIWRIIDVADVVLTVGNGYIVGGYNGNTSTDVLKYDVNDTVASQLTFVDATFSNINGNFERPTNFSAAVSGFYGPSFNYVDGAVPEPGSMIALGAGIAALLRRRKKA